MSKYINNSNVCFEVQILNASVEISKAKKKLLIKHSFIGDNIGTTGHMRT